MKIPVPPPDYAALLQGLAPRRSIEVFQGILSGEIGPAPGGKYRHWDILRHLEPPEGLTHEEWWLGVKLARSNSYQNLPFPDERDRPFRYVLHDAALRALHEIDRDASGHIRAPELVTSPRTRDTYLVKSQMEEAITSSQLEGAATTREAAKDMLQQGRKPRDPQ